jgi:hypothetical protein
VLMISARGDRVLWGLTVGSHRGVVGYEMKRKARRAKRGEQSAESNSTRTRREESKARKGRGYERSEGI